MLRTGTVDGQATMLDLNEARSFAGLLIITFSGENLGCLESCSGGRANIQRALWSAGLMALR